MNILFCFEVDYLRKIVFDMHLIAEAMSLRGHKVYVIDYEGLGGVDERNASKEILVNRAFHKSPITLIRPSVIKVNGLSRLSAFASHYVEIGRVIKEKKIDAIILYSVPTNGLQAVYWAKKYGIPIIFRSIDVLNQLVPYRALRPITKMMEKEVYSRVDRILTITPSLSEYVIKLGANPDKVSVLPMPVDTSTFRPSDNDLELRQTWGLGEKDKIILFMGTLFNFSGLDRFILQMPRIIKRVPEAKLLIVGDGEQYKTLKSIIFNYGLQDKVIITGMQPYRDMPRYINLADVCINPFVPNSITSSIFPGKTVQFLACGKPLVMRPLEGVKAVIFGENEGVVYADSDVGMANAVINLLNDAEFRKVVGDNGLSYARHCHHCGSVAESLESIIMELRR